MEGFCVIFDINGTLINTELAHFRGYKEALEQYDVELNLEDFTDHWSRQGKKLDSYLERIDRSDLVPIYKDIKHKKDIIFQTTLQERIDLMPNARETLERLHETNIPLGIDTSGSEENMHFMLSLFGLLAFFKHLACGESDIDETYYGPVLQKSSRLLYLADQFNLAPERCIMIGDAEKDIVGAKKAGMNVIAIPNEFTQTQDFSQADMVCHSLDDVTVEALEEVVSVKNVV